MEADALSGPPLDPEHLGRKENLDPFVTEEPPDGVRDVGILPADQLRPVLDHRHAAAETAVSLGQFEADIAAAEHDQVRGQAIEFEHLDVRERPGVRQAGELVGSSHASPG